jgi:hypothetical protein
VGLEPPLPLPLDDDVLPLLLVLVDLAGFANVPGSGVKGLRVLPPCCLAAPLVVAATA